MKIFDIAVLCCITLPLMAQQKSLIETLKTANTGAFDEAVRIRHHLHTIPETCNTETKTSRFVADYLQDLGLEVTTGIAGQNGVKAVLHGSKKGPVVGIRADMDALPITEATGLEWSSGHEGKMHACGHDIHMTNGLIAAKLLSSVKDRLCGTVVFIFQPCEEGASGDEPAGASAMVRAGVLDDPEIEAMFGLHVMPGFDVGTAALCEGPIMANVATVQISIHGRASHGAFPHEGIDAVYAASMAVIQFQSLISRIKDPNEKAVLSIGTINGGVRFNVIADRVDMEGTVRSFSEGTETMIEAGMGKILEGLRVSHGIEYDYRFGKGSRFVKNDPELTRRAMALFGDILGKDRLLTTDPMTVAEDFAVYSHRIPSVFFFLGAGEGALHSPDFAPDDEILRYGALLLASAAATYLEGSM